MRGWCMLGMCLICAIAITKLGKISTSPIPSTQTEVLGTQTEVLGFGAVRKQYTCNQCEEVFSKQGLLKKHKKIKHKLKDTKMGK